MFVVIVFNEECVLNYENTSMEFSVGPRVHCGLSSNYPYAYFKVVTAIIL
jgi:hypothetical protein